jgi:hypothetical protein
MTVLVQALSHALASSPVLGQIGQPKPRPRVPLVAVTLIPDPLR